MTRKLSAMNPLAWQGRPPQVIQISRLENLGMGTGHETVLLSQKQSLGPSLPGLGGTEIGVPASHASPARRPSEYQLT
eukprot:scaffold7053_cov380-Pinguiococcus_pyrenoidosus.AAC.7